MGPNSGCFLVLSPLPFSSREYDTIITISQGSPPCLHIAVEVKVELFLRMLHT